MSLISEWLVRVVDLAEAEAASIRRTVHEDLARVGDAVQRWTVGVVVLTLGGMLLAGASTLLLLAFFTALAPALGVPGAAALAALAAAAMAASAFVVHRWIIKP